MGVCREAGISEASYYNWKEKFDRMETSDIKRSKTCRIKTLPLNRVY
ncbi:transposase [Raoultella terrigena]|nr:transposase [Raoultella terrigena]